MKMMAFDGSSCVQWQRRRSIDATMAWGKRGRRRNNNQIEAAAGGDWRRKSTAADNDKRTVAAKDSEQRAVSGNGRRTAAAMEKERAGAAAEPSMCFVLIDYHCTDSQKECFDDVRCGKVQYIGERAAAPPVKPQRRKDFFAPEGMPDCALWTAQSFALRSV